LGIKPSQKGTSTVFPEPLLMCFVDW